MKQTRNKIAIVLVFVLLVAIGMFLMPMDAWAAKVVGLQLLIGQIQKIITILILPLSMIIAAWRIIYIAVFGGMMGMDPLNQISDKDKDGQINARHLFYTARYIHHKYF